MYRRQRSVHWSDTQRWDEAMLQEDTRMLARRNQPKLKPKIRRRPISGLSSGCRIHLESWQVYGEEAPEGKYEAMTRQGPTTGKCHAYHKGLGPQTCARTYQETPDITVKQTNENVIIK
jgi:hypothetical protein